MRVTTVEVGTLQALLDTERRGYASSPSMERELACFRQKLIPYGIIYIYFNNPLWYYIMVSSYCGFYLCFCLGHDSKYILLKGKAGSDYMLIVLCICSTSTLVFKLFRFKIPES